MNKIQRVSKLFRLLFQISFLLLPIMMIFFWISAPHPILIGGEQAGISITFIPEGIKILHPLSIQTKMLGFLVSLIPNGLYLCTLYFLIRLFKLYENHIIFSIHNIMYIKRIAYTLLLSQLLEPVYQGLISPLLTWHNPVGHRSIDITLSQTNVSILIIAVLMILISWIMTEGYELKEEQAYTV